MNIFDSAHSNLLKLWWFNGRLDDSRVSGHDGENHTGQKHQSQFVHIPAEGRRKDVSKHAGVCKCVCVCVCVGGYLLYPYKHHQSHQEQAACAINTHIV